MSPARERFLRERVRAYHRTYRAYAATETPWRPHLGQNNDGIGNPAPFTFLSAYNGAYRELDDPREKYWTHFNGPG